MEEPERRVHAHESHGQAPKDTTYDTWNAKALTFIQIL